MWIPWILYFCDWINWGVQWACYCCQWAIYAAVAGTVAREWLGTMQADTITLKMGGIR